MPARIVPRIEIAVHPSEDFRVGCMDCDWFTADVVDEAVARRLAYEHNRAKHDGAGVDVMAGDLVASMKAHLRFIRKQVRYHAMMGIGAALVITILNALTGGFVTILSTTAWLVVFFTEGQRYGRWAVRYEDERERLNALTAAEPPESEGEDGAA